MISCEHVGAHTQASLFSKWKHRLQTIFAERLQEVDAAGHLDAVLSGPVGRCCSTYNATMPTCNQLYLGYPEREQQSGAFITVYDNITR
jgi:hypothetical protein